MERREAPGAVVDPGLAPRPHICPVAITIGLPVAGHVARVPDGAVIRRALERAVLIEILGAGHLRRDIALGLSHLDHLGWGAPLAGIVADVAAVGVLRCVRAAADDQY